ncbi:DUF2141 domain-containing protein [Parapusillimonas sp. JC17]
METGFAGIPRKAYGFSNSPSSSLHIPRYDETRFTMSSFDAHVVIRLID